MLLAFSQILSLGSLKIPDKSRINRPLFRQIRKCFGAKMGSNGVWRFPACNGCEIVGLDDGGSEGDFVFDPEEGSGVEGFECELR